VQTLGQDILSSVLEYNLLNLLTRKSAGMYLSKNCCF
jgi:hypothetical protein